jgi:hypothetical protein
MSDSIFLIGLAVVGVLICAAQKQRAIDGMEDTPVAASQIRRGVKNGWYTCTLLVVQDTPAVRLSGKTADGKDYSDIYPVTPEDWSALKAEGYKVETKKK